MKTYSKNRLPEKRKLKTSELQALRLAKFRIFFQNEQKQKGKKYYSIAKMREVIIEIDTEELELEYSHEDLGNPTERQIFEIHSEVFDEGTKERAVNLIFKDYFHRPNVTYDHMKSKEGLGELWELLKEQGIEYKLSTLEKKVRKFVKSKDNISIRSLYAKQLDSYADLKSRIMNDLSSNKIPVDKALSLLLRLEGNRDKLGAQSLGQVIAREEGYGLDEENMPNF